MVQKKDAAPPHSQGLRFFRHPNWVSRVIHQELWRSLEEPIKRAEAAQKWYPKSNPPGNRAQLLLDKNEMVIATMSMSATRSA